MMWREMGKEVHTSVSLIAEDVIDSAGRIDSDGEAVEASLKGARS
jgi:hypothetical protein